MTALHASGLGKRYRQRWALSDCTLEIPEGRVAGLVGPNGAGKSTLLNLAVGLLTPDAGTITVLDGQPGGGAGSAGPGRFRGSGHPGLRRPERGRSSALRRPPQPRLGRRLRRATASSGSAWIPASGRASCPGDSEPSSP